LQEIHFIRGPGSALRPGEAHELRPPNGDHRLSQESVVLPVSLSALRCPEAVRAIDMVQ